MERVGNSRGFYPFSVAAHKEAGSLSISFGYFYSIFFLSTSGNMALYILPRLTHTRSVWAKENKRCALKEVEPRRWRMEKMDGTQYYTDPGTFPAGGLAE